MGCDQTLFLNFYDFLKYIPSWVQSNSEILKIILAFFSLYFALYKYLKQKRAEAFFGFYSKLRIDILSIYKILTYKDLLNISCNDNTGNIFSLMYVDDLRNKYNPIINDEIISVVKRLKVHTDNLKQLLLNSENNVCPKWVPNKKWYMCQQVVYEFCELIDMASDANPKTYSTEYSKYDIYYFFSSKFLNYIFNCDITKRLFSIKILNYFKSKFYGESDSPLRNRIHTLKCVELKKSIKFLLSSINKISY
jgi:hypothetical protein